MAPLATGGYEFLCLERFIKKYNNTVIKFTLTFYNGQVTAKNYEPYLKCSQNMFSVNHKSCF